MNTNNTPVIPGATLVAALVDRSGSMTEHLDGMEDGLNDFIAEQAAVPVPGALMLAQFDHEFEVVWPIRPLSGAPRYRLIPRGSTALYDGIGRTIFEINDQLSRESQFRPVVVAIVTDGAENASLEFDLKTVKQWIAHMRDEYGWTFIFLGADLDAVAVGTRLGIDADHALTFNPHNAKGTYKILSKHVTELRTKGQAAFSSQDRRKAIEGK